MKQVLFLLPFLGAVYANADTVCSTPGQNLTYSMDLVESGMPPMNGDLISKETLIFDGVDYGENTVVQGLNYQPYFSINFDMSTKRQLDYQGNGNGSKETYTVYIESINTTPTGSMTLVPVQQFVICTEAVVAVP